MLQNLTLNNTYFLRPDCPRTATQHRSEPKDGEPGSAKGIRKQNACVHGALATTLVNVFTLTLLVPSPTSARMVTRRSESWNPSKT